MVEAVGLVGRRLAQDWPWGCSSDRRMVGASWPWEFEAETMVPRVKEILFLWE